MNLDTVEGTTTEWSGRAKEAAGVITGDTHLRAEGLQDQVVGRAQNLFGNAKDFATQNPVTSVIMAGFVGILLGSCLRRR